MNALTIKSWSLSDPGKRHPVTRGLEGANVDPPNWSRWFRLVNTKAQSGTSVMEGPDKKPLLVLSREGDGRVGLLLSDHIWLWARGYEGGGPHLDLMRRLSHWLMKQPDLEEEALRLIVRGNNLVIDAIHDDGPEIPVRMAPMVLLGTVLTHLFGGSAGTGCHRCALASTRAGVAALTLELGHFQTNALGKLAHGIDIALADCVGFRGQVHVAVDAAGQTA